MPTETFGVQNVLKLLQYGQTLHRLYVHIIFTTLFGPVGHMDGPKHLRGWAVSAAVARWRKRGLLSVRFFFFSRRVGYHNVKPGLDYTQSTTKSNTSQWQARHQLHLHHQRQSLSRARLVPIQFLSMFIPFPPCRGEETCEPPTTCMWSSARGGKKAFPPFAFLLSRSR